MSSSNHHLEQVKTANGSICAPDILDQLERVLCSETFKQSPRSAAFLKFVVEQAAAGRADSIKARKIAISVFDRSPDEGPENDPIVRIQAGRLRKRLKEYYEQEGTRDPIGRFEKTIGELDESVKTAFYSENFLRLWPEARVD